MLELAKEHLDSDRVNFVIWRFVGTPLIAAGSLDGHSPSFSWKWFADNVCHTRGAGIF